jgi:hypothetical protein
MARLVGKQKISSAEADDMRQRYADWPGASGNFVANEALRFSVNRETIRRILRGETHTRTTLAGAFGQAPGLPPAFPAAPLAPTSTAPDPAAEESARRILASLAAIGRRSGRGDAPGTRTADADADAAHLRRSFAMKIGSFTSARWGSVLVTQSTYAVGLPAVVLVDADGELLIKLSVCLPDAPRVIWPFFWAKTWSENGELAAEALASGLFADTGTRTPAGHAMAQLWRFNGPEAPKNGAGGKI